MVEVETPLVFVAAWGALVDVGIDPGVVSGRVAALIIELLGDGDSEVREIDILVLRAGPSSVTAYPQ
jgi:saccharopine dehydrogenase-like NADP-dependent oxidoreductase